MNKGKCFVLLLFLAITALMPLCLVTIPFDGQVSEHSYSRVTSGMTVAQVTQIIGEGEIHHIDNRLAVMKYVGEGIEIRVVFVHGIVYQKSLELNGVITSQVDLFTPEIIL